MTKKKKKKKREIKGKHESEELVSFRNTEFYRAMRT